MRTFAAVLAVAALLFQVAFAAPAPRPGGPQARGGDAVDTRTTLRDARLDTPKPKGYDDHYLYTQKFLKDNVYANLDDIATRAPLLKSYLKAVADGEKKIFELTLNTGWHNTTFRKERLDQGRTLERRAYVGSGLNAASVRASLQVYALLAGTAYCSADTLTNWNCKGCTDSRIASTHDVTVVTASSMQGWVGVNENLKTIVVAFRGSSNFDNWLANLNFLKTDLSLPGAPSAVKVHSGFYNVWTAIKPSITPLVNNLKSRYPSYTVSFTGHSLGAAVATFAAIDAKNSGQATASNIVLSTVGEPRIGNTDFSNYVISLNFGVHRRAVNYNDIVPHLPPSSFSFAHRLSEEWIDSASDSVYCDDGSNSGEDTNCANTTPPWVSTSAHLVYDGVTLGGGAC